MKNTERNAVKTEAEDDAFIAAFVAKYCRPHAVVLAERLAAFVAARQMALVGGGLDDFALAAGPAAPNPVAVQAPDEEVTFTFASDGAPDAPGAWRAALTVPPKAVSETMLTLTVSNAAGEPFDTGLFTLSGVALPLLDGRAEIPFGLFLAGIKDTNVSFARSGEEVVTGTLAFFC